MPEDLSCCVSIYSLVVESSHFEVEQSFLKRGAASCFFSFVLVLAHWFVMCSFVDKRNKSMCLLDHMLV